jgi:hypothetical protein
VAGVCAKMLRPIKARAKRKKTFFIMMFLKQKEGI